MKSIDEMCPNVGGTDIDENVTSELIEKMSGAISTALKESAESTQEIVSKFTETIEKISKEESEEKADEQCATDIQYY